MATPPPSVLIIGAGELGLSVATALSAHPKRNNGRISILLRPATLANASADPARRAQNARLRALGAALEPGDAAADDVPTLAAAFAPHHTVVVCAGFGLPPGTQEKLARAALAASVRRFVPWQFGVDYDAVGAGSAQDLFDEQLAVRGLLRAQAGDDVVDWVVVSTGLFASFLFEPGFGAVDLRARTVRALGSWDNGVTVTTVADVGRMAAEVVYEPPPHGGGGGGGGMVVFVGGDTVTYARVAELVQRRFGGEWRREVWDCGLLRERLRRRPDDVMVKYQNVFAEGTGVSWDMATTLNRRRGIELQDLESYLRQMEDE